MHTFLDVMVATLQQLGTSGLKRGWSQEASMTLTLVICVANAPTKSTKQLL